MYQEKWWNLVSPDYMGYSTWLPAPSGVHPLS